MKLEDLKAKTANVQYLSTGSVDEMGVASMRPTQAVDFSNKPTVAPKFELN